MLIELGYLLFNTLSVELFVILNSIIKTWLAAGHINRISIIIQE